MRAPMCSIIFATMQPKGVRKLRPAGSTRFPHGRGLTDGATAWRDVSKKRVPVRKQSAARGGPKHGCCGSGGGVTVRSASTKFPDVETSYARATLQKNKIVNLTIPEVRSIPRGKVGKDVEFGFKWGLLRVDGFILGEVDPGRGNFSDPRHAVEAVELHTKGFGV